MPGQISVSRTGRPKIRVFHHGQKKRFPCSQQTQTSIAAPWPSQRTWKIFFRWLNFSLWRDRSLLNRLPEKKNQPAVVAKAVRVAEAGWVEDVEEWAEAVDVAAAAVEEEEVVAVARAEKVQHKELRPFRERFSFQLNRTR